MTYLQKYFLPYCFPPIPENAVHLTVSEIREKLAGDLHPLLKYKAQVLYILEN